QWRLVRQTLAESVLLTAVAGALGLASSTWGTAILSAIVAAGPVGFNVNPTAGTLDARTDLRVFSFTAVLCLLATVIVGLAPALAGRRSQLTLRLAGRGVSPARSRGELDPARLFVIAQVAACLPILTGAGLFLRTLHHLRADDVGVDRNHVLMAWT